MVNWDFLYGTRGWADLKNLGDAFRGFTPPSHCSGALIALQSVEPECRFSLTTKTQTKNPT
jgi:hypothetical protein